MVNFTSPSYLNLYASCGAPPLSWQLLYDPTDKMFVLNIHSRCEYQYVYWENDGMDCYQRYDTGENSAPVNVSPARGLVGTTVPVTIFGGGFDQSSTPSVQISGSRVTASDINLVSTGAISANFNITSDAASGNHSVTVTSYVLVFKLKSTRGSRLRGRLDATLKVGEFID